MKVLEFLAW